MVFSSTSFEGSGLGVVFVLFSMSVISWMSSLGARGKMGPSSPSVVPGFKPPHSRFFSSPFFAAVSIRLASVGTTFAVAKGRIGRGESCDGTNGLRGVAKCESSIFVSIFWDGRSFHGAKLDRC